MTHVLYLSDMEEAGIPISGYDSHAEMVGWYSRLEDTRGSRDTQWLGPYDDPMDALTALEEENGLDTLEI